MVNNFIKRNKYLFIFLSVIFFISLIFGVIIFKKLNNDTKLTLINNLSNIKQDLVNNHINNLFNHILIIIVIILLSLSILGYFLGVFYLFYEGMAISFTCASLFKIYGLKGLIFAFIYNILFKLIYLILLLILLIKLFNLVKNIISYIIYKKKINLRKYIINFLLIILLIFINDLFLYFFGNFIIKMLINML